jgi:uncharacterized SAM-binding protein YcdF (DUF218 family)
MSFIRFFQRHWFLGLSCLLFIMIGILMLGTAKTWLPGIGHWLALSPNAQKVDAIVVLGNSLERTQQGIELYHQKLSSELWQTGAGPNRLRTRLATQMAKERDVPTEAFHLLASSTTWEDGQQIVARTNKLKLQSILIVTEWTHSRRALCVIKKQLAGSSVRVYYDSPPIQSYSPDNWWQSRGGRVRVVRELVKIFFYSLRYGIVPWRC